MDDSSGCPTLAALMPEIRRSPPRTEIIFDGTKLALERRRPKTTTYGMKLLFSPELGSLQGNRSFTHGFVSGKFDQHRFRFMLLSSLHRRVVNARLFLGQVVNHDDQQDHHQYADHRPNPHPSAHPSVCVVHHVLLRSFLFAVGVRLTTCLRNQFRRDRHGCQHSNCAGGGGFAMGYNPTVNYGGTPPAERMAIGRRSFP